MKGTNKKIGKREVLVAVLKSWRDLRILLEEKWYRIPLSFLPKRKFVYAAFYQPAIFGKNGKRITYFARVVGTEIKKRIELLPREMEHPRASADYLKISFKKVEKLEKPIRNIIPRRVSFGFTDIKTLRSAGDILELYAVPPTEQILERGLNQLGIQTFPQHTISKEDKHYRLDLAIFCRNGAIAIECDNRKAHSFKIQKLKDKRKDKDLKKLGWRVVRLTEGDIVGRLGSSVARIQKAIHSLGGQNP